MANYLTRQGVTLAEVMVSATLLISGMSLVARVSYECDCLWQQSRQHRLALDELTNQLQYLVSLDRAARVSAVSELAPSAAAQAGLPGVVLGCDVIEDQHGFRLVADIDWDQMHDQPPLVLTAWVNRAEPSAL